MQNQETFSGNGESNFLLKSVLRKERKFVAGRNAKFPKF